MRKASLPLRQLGGLFQALQAAPAGTQALTYSATERQLSSQAASTSGHGSSFKWRRITFPLLAVGALAGGAWSLTTGERITEEEFHLLPLDMRQRIFFKYEKRIRDQSPLDKVFEYFSTQEQDGQEFLTPVDMLRAVVPTYPPSESTADRSGYLAGEPRSKAVQPNWSKSEASFFQQFDVDGDGTISYPEFLLLLTLLSIPGKDVKTIFDVVDLDSNGYLDKSEFMVVVELLQGMANVHTSSVGRSKKLLLDGTHAGLFVAFFGKDGSKKLYLPEFRDFLDRLHDELVRLEFRHYDCNRTGSITALDFGRSLAATADIRNVDRLLDKVDAMVPELARQRLTLEEFRSVAEMRRNVHTLVVALEFFRQVGRSLSKDDFSKLLVKLMRVSLSAKVLDVIFAVFDDGDGALDVPAFLEAMQRREVMWARRRNPDADGAPTDALLRALDRIRSWLPGGSTDLAGFRVPA